MNIAAASKESGSRRDNCIECYCFLNANGSRQ
jgi:hypothetical protein